MIMQYAHYRDCDTGGRMKLSVVIPTYKPDRRLVQIVDKIMDQTEKPDRFIIINSCDKEEVKAGNSLINNLVEKYGKDILEVKNIPASEFDHGGTRHMAMEMCDTEYVLFMTQDAVPKDEFLIERMASALSRDEKAAAVYARQLPDEKCNPIERYTREFNYPAESSVKTKADLERFGIKTYFLSDACAMYKKSIYDSLDGFPRQTIFAEDMIYASKAIEADMHIIYEAKAEVIHSHNYTARQQYRRNYDVGLTHSRFNYIFDKVKSESEGIKMVKITAKRLIQDGYWYLIPKLIIHSACKYLGYRAGKKSGR